MDASTMKAPEALKTIGEVASILNVPQHVLRFWEGKFPDITPQKRRGRRYYHGDDIEKLQYIKKLLYHEGYTIRGVQQHLCKNTPPAPAADAHEMTLESALTELKALRTILNDIFEPHA